jgi:hypothetical protein
MAYGLFVLIRLEVEDVECAPSRECAVLYDLAQVQMELQLATTVASPCFLMDPVGICKEKNIMAQQRRVAMNLQDWYVLDCFGIKPSSVGRETILNFNGSSNVKIAGGLGQYCPKQPAL